MIAVVHEIDERQGEKNGSTSLTGEPESGFCVSDGLVGL